MKFFIQMESKISCNDVNQSIKKNENNNIYTRKETRKRLF